MNKGKLNFIITTLNGYVIERINLADYETEPANNIINKLFEQTFTSKHIGEFNYVDDIAGNVDDIESFITNKNNLKCNNDDSPEFSIKKNYYIETYHTNIGYFPDFYVGLEIKQILLKLKSINWHKLLCRF